MTARQRDTNGTDSRGLAGRSLEEHIGRLEYERPDLVRRVLPDGTIAQTVVKRAAPRRRGKFAHVDPSELPKEWADAVARIRTRAANVTLQAIALELHVNVRTASRYRQRYGLTIGDR